MRLDQKQKDLFLMWLTQTAEESHGMAEQAEKIGVDILVKRERAKEAACAIIINELSTGELVTLDG